nr:LysR family transcriptional regulator [Corallococcus exiguus]
MTRPACTARTTRANVPRVSITHLQSFVAVAEEGHVGRAALRLHITQPPLSRHILALEDELGTPLFERVPKGMRLLPTGEALLHHARRILAEVEVATLTVREAAGGSGASKPPHT